MGLICSGFFVCFPYPRYDLSCISLLWLHYIVWDSSVGFRIFSPEIFLLARSLKNFSSENCEVLLPVLFPT